MAATTPRLLALLLLALLVLVARGQQQHGVGGKRPFSRLQATVTGDASGPAAAAEEDEAAALEKDFTKPTDKVGYMLNLTKNGVDPVEILSSSLNSRGFKTLLQHPEVLHRVLEEVPLLEAFDGFKELKEGGRRLSAEESATHFKTGVTALIDFAKSSMTKNKNPAMGAETIAKMATSNDPAMKDLFKRAQAGDPTAVEALQDAFAKQEYSGFNHALFRDIAKRHTASPEAGAKMRAIPELMYFVDKDPTVSSFFRNPVTREGIAEFEEQAKATAART